MVLAKIHDALFFQKNNQFYCNKIDYDMMVKFLEFFEKIIVIARKGPDQKGLVQIDLENVSIILVDRYKTPFQFFSKLQANRKIFELIVAKCDLIYCRGFNGVLAQRIALKLGKPSLTFVGGCVYDSMVNLGVLTKKILALPVFLIVRNSIYKSDYVIYVAEYLQQRYPTMGMFCTWSGVKITNYSQLMYEKRMERFENGGGINIGLIGYFNNNVKGIDVALRALTILQNNYRLLVLGSGNKEKYINISKKNNLGNRIAFCGVLEGGKEVLTWLDNIDIYIQPSRTEGLPKATLEAMSRGCPVISSNVGGLPDIVDSNYIFKSGDFKKLAELIHQLSNDKVEIGRMINYSIQTAKKYYPEKLDGVFNSFMLKIMNNLETIN